MSTSTTASLTSCKRVSGFGRGATSGLARQRFFSRARILEAFNRCLILKILKELRRRTMRRNVHAEHSHRTLRFRSNPLRVLKLTNILLPPRQHSLLLFNARPPALPQHIPQLRPQVADNDRLSRTPPQAGSISRSRLSKCYRMDSGD
jgi:hypothetical protein